MPRYPTLWAVPNAMTATNSSAGFALSEPVLLPEQELRLAIEHCHEMANVAGPITLQYFRQPLQIDNKAAAGDFDPVTRADRAAEEAIRDVIRRRRPEDGILGEEHGFDQGTSGMTWIIDPIDGTRAFISGLPMWGTLIALFNGRSSVLGMMDQPYLRERYLGSRLGAHYIEGEKAPVDLIATARKELNSAILLCTSPEIYTAAELQQFNQVADAVATVRYGTDCYGYAMLAAGHVDLVIESALQAYDIQPLIPIIEAAGGIVTDWHGQAVTGGGQVVAAASQSLADSALALLNQQ